MSDYTPTAQRIKDVWVTAGAPFTSPSKRTTEFDRAIAKVRTEAKAEALREAADSLEAVLMGTRTASQRLRTYADNLEAS